MVNSVVLVCYCTVLLGLVFHLGVLVVLRDLRLLLWLWLLVWYSLCFTVFRPVVGWCSG